MATALIADTNRIRREGALGLGTGSSFTILFWVRPTNVSNVNRRMCLMSGTNAEIRMSSTTNRLDGNCSIGGITRTLSQTSAIFDNTNYLVGLSYSGSNFRLWLNGDNVQTLPVTGAIIADTGFHIGETGTGTMITGEYGDVRVYNDTLTAAEHSLIYELKGRDGIYRNLLLRWIFIENPPTTTITNNMIKDVSGNGFAANAINSTPTIGNCLIPLGYRKPLKGS